MYIVKSDPQKNTCKIKSGHIFLLFLWELDSYEIHVSIRTSALQEMIRVSLIERRELMVLFMLLLGRYNHSGNL